RAEQQEDPPKRQDRREARLADRRHVGTGFLIEVVGDGQLGAGADGRRDRGADNAAERMQTAAATAATAAAVQRGDRGPAAALGQVRNNLNRRGSHSALQSWRLVKFGYLNPGQEGIQARQRGDQSRLRLALAGPCERYT